MIDYTLTCVSGTVVLVSADSAEEAEAEWDAEVAAGNAEPRITGTTELASDDDVVFCEEQGQDYREVSP